MGLQGLSLMKRLIDFYPGYFVNYGLLALVPAKYMNVLSVILTLPVPSTFLVFNVRVLSER